MKTKTTLLFLLICAFIKAQSISDITFSNGGEYLSNGTNSINATIGEAIVGTISNTETLHQGFWASSFSLETLEVTELTKIDDNLSIFPNPVDDILTIKSSTSMDYVVTIFNTEGKIILQSNVNGKLENSMKLDTLSSGLYLLQIKDQSSSFTKSIKFLKQ